MGSQVLVDSSALSRLLESNTRLVEMVQGLSDRFDRLQGLEQDDWRPTSKAWKAIGLTSAKTLRDRVYDGILPVDDMCVKDVSRNPDVTRYKFNVPMCIKQIQRFDALPVAERQRIVDEARAERAA